MTEKKQRLAELDGVRALSILLVLSTHLLPVGPSSWNLNAMTGLMGMSLFFCLSGFLITTFLIEDGDVPSFFRRRMARILPLLYLYAVIVALIVNHRFDTFVAILLSYLNYSDSALTAEGVSHLWSICVEVHFYAIIGISVLALGRRGLWIIPILLVAVLAFRISTGTFVSIRTHLRMDEILVGGLLAVGWANRGRAPNAQRLAIPAFVVALPLWLLSCHELGGALQYARGFFAMTLVGSLLLMSDNVVRRTARLPIFGYIAKISYALYIWHPLMRLGWLGTGGGWERYLVKRPLTFVLTFLAAHISTHTFEAYFQAWARRTGRNKSGPKAPSKAGA